MLAPADDAEWIDLFGQISRQLAVGERDRLREYRELGGRERFAAAGGDFGAVVTQQLAARHPDAVVGIHLTYVGYSARNREQPGLSPTEEQYLDGLERWFMREGGYAHIQATKPQSLAFALNDSPAGLAAWIVEKFRTWSDCDGDVERRFTKDELLTNVALYWFTNSIGSSVRIYYEFRADPVRAPLGTPSGRIEIFSAAIDGFGYPDCPGHPTWLPPTEWLGAPFFGGW